MNLRVSLAVLFMLWAGTAPNAGQSPAPAVPQTPTFKVQVDYVEVDVLVTDQRGNFVRDLKKDDFQVFEDGKPQTVSNFAIVDIPIERADRPLFAKQPIEPDVQTNERPFDGRVYVILLDTWHTNAQNTNLVRRAARKFIQENLGANDLAAVIHVGARSTDSQEFTGNRRLLLASVDHFIGMKPRSATLEKLDQFIATQGIRSGADVSDPFEMERGYHARGTIEELTAVADWFGSVRGRKKTILFFSEGIDYNVEDVFNNRDASMLIEQTRDLIRSATKANVSIYAIDPKGLTALADGDIELQGVNSDDPQAADLNSRGLRNELRLAQNSLRTFAEETGGFAVLNTNGFTNAFGRIVQENSSYYVLAYYPPSPKRDGKFHKIDVRVTRPGVTVRARRGYANPTGKAPAPLPTNGKTSVEVRDALASPLPISGLTMKVFAAPFKGAAPNASVLVGVELRGRDLKTDANSKVELSWIAVDAQGKIRGGGNGAVTLNLKPETRARVDQTGLRLLNRMDVPPGRYLLRVAGREATTGSVGSVQYDLEVPDFYKGPLVMSGVVLTSATSAALPTAQPDADLRQVLPGPPVAIRSFPQNDEMALFAEIYDNQTTSAPHKVDITTTITSDEGRVVFKNEEERSSEDLGGKRGGYGYGTRIQLKDLSPGSYVLKVEARSRLGESPTASREVQFTVGSPKTP